MLGRKSVSLDIVISYFSSERSPTFRRSNSRCGAMSEKLRIISAEP